MPFHPKNKHQGSYDFNKLIEVEPQLKELIVKSKTGRDTLKFSDPKAVKFLNRALLRSWYNLEFWDFPAGFLVPPIPGRAEYIHNVAQLSHQKQPTVLDIGTGASLVFPIIGKYEYGWNFIASDISKKSFKSCKQIIGKNKLKGIDFRLQNDASKIFHGIIKEEDSIEISICNPPFHDSAESATAGSKRKAKNLGLLKKGEENPVLNFSGRDNELITPGGERKFITSMINESKHYKNQIKWFTTLVSREKNLKPLLAALKQTNPTQTKVIEMEQGNKKSRILCWSYV